MSTKIIPETIIKRGYVTTDEYEAMSASKKLEKVNLGKRKAGSDEQEDVEGIWVYPLESTDTPGTKFHFVLFNDPVFTRGPRPLAGMVGVGHATGRDSRGRAYTDECIELFKKAGQAAIDYHNSVVAAENAKKEKN